MNQEVYNINEKDDFATMIKNVKEMISIPKTDRNGDPIIKKSTNTPLMMIPKTIESFETILNNDIRFKGVIKYNEFSERIEIVNSSWESKKHCLKDSDDSKMLSIIEKSYNIYNENKFSRAVENISRLNAYNPIKQILEKLKWDGKDRITTLFQDTLGAENSKYNANVAKVMLLGAINRIYDPGCKFDYCVILSSENTQGLGKSSLIRKLAMEDIYYTDSLRTLETDTNTLQLLRGKWFVELGELKALNKCKGGVEGVKQFLSTQTDTYRDSYAKHARDYERKCIFVGTTNKSEYLIDDTGNRRFLPVICATDDNSEAMKKIKYHMYEDSKEIKDYIAQVWAQAMHIYKNDKYSLVLDKENEKELENLHKEARVYNPMADEIQNYIDNLANGEYISVKSVYIDVYNDGMKTSNIPKDRRNEIKAILSSNDIKDIKKVNKSVRTKYGVARGYKVVRIEKKEEFKSLPKELETEFKQVGFLK